MDDEMLDLRCRFISKALINFSFSLLYSFKKRDSEKWYFDTQRVFSAFLDYIMEVPEFKKLITFTEIYELTFEHFIKSIRKVNLEYGFKIIPDSEILPLEFTLTKDL